MQLHFDDAELDGQLQRTMVKALARSADPGEALAAAARIEPGDPDSWYSEWFDLGEAVAEIARVEVDRGQRVSARDAWLRACEYYRQAYFFRRRDVTDPRLLEAWHRCRDAFRQAIPHLGHPCETVAIPYEDTNLGGYLVAPDDSGSPRGTLVVPCGYDSPTEEQYASVAVEALLRGWSVLLFAGPGQAELLYEQHRYFRHDFEAVVGPVVEFLAGRDDVDDDKLVLVGRSFGGYLAPRAAAFEPRLAAMAADPGQMDMGRIMRSRLPQRWVRMLDADDPALDEEFWEVFGDVHGREFWGARMSAHGITEPRAYLKEMERWTVPAERIRCPSWVSQGEGDFAGGLARELFEAIDAPKHFREFTEDEGAGGHCESLGPTRFWQELFAWLDEMVGGP